MFTIDDEHSERETKTQKSRARAKSNILYKSRNGDTLCKTPYNGAYS